MELILLGAMVVSLLITKTVSDGRTDHQLAKKGLVSPRLERKHGSAEAARQATAGYGLGRHLYAAWRDYWPRRTEALRRSRDMRAAAGEAPRPIRQVVRDAVQDAVRVVVAPVPTRAEREQRAAELKEQAERIAAAPQVVPEPAAPSSAQARQCPACGSYTTAPDGVCFTCRGKGTETDCVVCGLPTSDPSGACGPCRGEGITGDPTAPPVFYANSARPRTEALGRECLRCGGPAAHTTEDHQEFTRNVRGVAKATSSTPTNPISTEQGEEQPVSSVAELAALIDERKPTCPKCGQTMTPVTNSGDLCDALVGHGSSGQSLVARYQCGCGTQDVDLGPQENKGNTKGPAMTTTATSTPTGEAVGIIGGAAQAQALQASTVAYGEQVKARMDAFEQAVGMLDASAAQMGFGPQSNVVQALAAAAEAFAAASAAMTALQEEVPTCLAVVAKAFADHSGIVEVRAMTGQVGHDSAYTGD